MLGGIFRFVASFGPWVMLGCLLFGLGILLSLLGLVFGFDLGDVDLWLEAHGGFFHAVGKLLLRIIFGIFLLIFLSIAVLPFFSLRSKEKPRWGCALLAVPAAWFCWIGTFGDY